MTHILPCPPMSGLQAQTYLLFFQTYTIKTHLRVSLYPMPRRIHDVSPAHGSLENGYCRQVFMVHFRTCLIDTVMSFFYAQEKRWLIIKGGW